MIRGTLGPEEFLICLCALALKQRAELSAQFRRAPQDPQCIDLGSSGLFALIYSNSDAYLAYNGDLVEPLYAIARDMGRQPLLSAVVEILGPDEDRFPKTVRPMLSPRRSAPGCVPFQSVQYDQTPGRPKEPSAGVRVHLRHLHDKHRLLLMLNMV